MSNRGVLATADYPRKLIVAHRGDRMRARENTLDAFRDAIACGADMIEFDVRRTRDGRLVVHHDPNVGERSIAAMEYEEVAGWSAYAVPLLSEVLEVAAGRIQIDVELKESGYERDVLGQIFAAGLGADAFVITSFLAEALKTIGDAARTGLLVEEMSWNRALELYRATGADFLAPEYRMIAGAPGAEVPLLPWTVNDADSMLRLLAIPAVFGVITDQPRQAIRLCEAAI